MGGNTSKAEPKLDETKKVENTGTNNNNITLQGTVDIYSFELVVLVSIICVIKIVEFVYFVYYKHIKNIKKKCAAENKVGPPV